MTIKTRAFFLGYGQKAASRVNDFNKGIGNLVKVLSWATRKLGFAKGKGATSTSLAQPAGGGRVLAGKLFPDTTMMNYGLPVTAGVGTAGASYYYDEDPNKGVMRHALRGLGVGTTVSRPYWRTMKSKLPGVGPEMGVLAGLGTGAALYKAPDIAKWSENKIDQIDRITANVDVAARHAAAGTGDLNTLIGDIQKKDIVGDLSRASKQILDEDLIGSLGGLSKQIKSDIIKRNKASDSYSIPDMVKDVTEAAKKSFESTGELHTSVADLGKNIETGVTAVAEATNKFNATLKRLEENGIIPKEVIGAITTTAEHVKGTVSASAGQLGGKAEEIKTAVNDYFTGLRESVSDVRKKLPYIFAALAVTGVGLYAIHQYIGYRMAKAVKNDEDDEDEIEKSKKALAETSS